MSTRKLGNLIGYGPAWFMSGQQCSLTTSCKVAKALRGDRMLLSNVVNPHSAFFLDEYIYDVWEATKPGFHGFFNSFFFLFQKSALASFLFFYILRHRCRPESPGIDLIMTFCLMSTMQKS